ncbi:cytochrome C biogenesis protein (plasmid) [Legionella adelaidensis]|uniref:Cytochrome C biogenesis protein n=1 Tax=Legionella adelaidensis TaxID=45056 RepID=A0A0W0R4E3_9GAMM|nr:DsbE family thiol:disulfide interchange protein [Legionella adelaidensis]KTC65906.1 cytochrome C biogenesis protein [Legionella adelaidensis]VEH85526.1 cytochrome C biogenesis protein [Legionella adelaidensis]
MTKLWKLTPLLIFAILGVFFWRGLFTNPHLIPSVQVGKPLAKVTLPLLDKPNNHAPIDSLKGKIHILNVWASWCSSCSEEQYFLVDLAHQGVPILGLNYKDSPIDAKKWLQDWGNPYQQVFTDEKGKVAIELGVYGTPETFLIDKKGIILYRHAGVLNSAIWQKEFLPRILNAEKVNA